VSGSSTSRSTPTAKKQGDVRRILAHDRLRDRDRLGREHHAVERGLVAVLAEAVVEAVARVDQGAEAPLRRLTADAEHTDGDVELHPRAVQAERLRVLAVGAGRRRVAGEQRGGREALVVAPHGVRKPADLEVELGELPILEHRPQPQPVVHVARVAGLTLEQVGEDVPAHAVLAFEVDREVRALEQAELGVRELPTVVHQHVVHAVEAGLERLEPGELLVGGLGGDVDRGVPVARRRRVGGDGAGGRRGLVDRVGGVLGERPAAHAAREQRDQGAHGILLFGRSEPLSAWSPGRTPGTRRPRRCPSRCC
jgi:hypothetical protein